MNTNNKCLTCRKEERIVGKSPYKYYGWWCFCNCPRYWDPPWWEKPIISLANNGKQRKQPMFTYGILARTMLQEADEADKKGPITGILSFEITDAVDFADAADKATELLPDNYTVISVTEIGTTATE